MDALVKSATDKLEALEQAARELGAIRAVYTSPDGLVEATADGNGALQDLLMNQGIVFTPRRPHCLDKGDVVFLDTGEGAVHADFVSHAWTDDPLTWLFDRIPGFPRGKGGACKPGVAGQA